MRFFFYGTLLDAAVRRAVLGRTVRVGLRPAVLRGWRSMATGGGAYPILLPAPGRSVRGAVASGLGRADALRLDAYEGAGYRRVRLPLRLGAALIGVEVYLPVAGHPHDRRPWRLEAWRKRRKPAFLAALRAAPGTAADMI